MFRAACTSLTGNTDIHGCPSCALSRALSRCAAEHAAPRALHSFCGDPARRRHSRHPVHASAQQPGDGLHAPQPCDAAPSHEHDSLFSTITIAFQLLDTKADKFTACEPIAATEGISLTKYPANGGFTARTNTATVAVAGAHFSVGFLKMVDSYSGAYRACHLGPKAWTLFVGCPAASTTGRPSCVCALPELLLFAFAWRHANSLGCL